MTQSAPSSTLMTTKTQLNSGEEKKREEKLHQEEIQRYFRVNINRLILN